MTRIERVTSPLPRECSTTEPHGQGDTCTSFSTAPTKPGAGEGNRTLVVSLEGFCSTIELHPQVQILVTATTPLHCGLHPRPTRTVQRTRFQHNTGGGGWIRTNVGVRQQIYSLPPLATRAPLRAEPEIMVWNLRRVKLLTGRQEVQHLAAGLLKTDAHRE